MRGPGEIDITRTRWAEKPTLLIPMIINNIKNFEPGSHKIISEQKRLEAEQKGQELNYAARVSLDRTDMQVDDRLVNLSPGMAVTVEIKTGSRRIITYLLSPLLRYGHDSLRER